MESHKPRGFTSSLSKRLIMRSPSKGMHDRKPRSKLATPECTSEVVSFCLYLTHLDLRAHCPVAAQNFMRLSRSKSQNHGPSFGLPFGYIKHKKQIGLSCLRVPFFGKKMRTRFRPQPWASTPLGPDLPQAAARRMRTPWGARTAAPREAGALRSGASIFCRRALLLVFFGGRGKSGLPSWGAS